MDVKVLSALQLSREQMSEGVKVLSHQAYWANEYEMTGAAGHYMKDSKVDGIITVTAFGCGPDSLMIERIMRNFPGGPVAKTPHFNAGSMGLIPGWGTKIPHAPWCSQKK